MPLRRAPERRDRPGGDRKSINAGGVCDNCGLPGFAHDGESCLDDVPPETVRRIAAWRGIVDPAREAYQRARRDAGEARRLRRKLLATDVDVEAAARRADELLIEYRAAIRRADRELT